MRNIILILIFIKLSVSCTNIYGQNHLDNSIYKYLAKNCKYPQELQTDPFRTGERIGVKFTINKSGQIDSVEVYTTTSSLLAEKVKGVIMGMNSWLDKEYANRTYILPIIYSTIEKDKDKKMLEQNRGYFSKSPHLDYYPECKNNCIVLKTIESFVYPTVH